MKKATVLLVCVLMISSITVGCGRINENAPVKGDTRKIIAQKYVDAIFNEDYAALVRFPLSLQLRFHLLTRNEYKKVKKIFTDACGQFLKKVDVLESERGDYRIVTIAGRFEKTYADINVVFNSNNKITGIHYIYNRIYDDMGDKEELVLIGDSKPLTGALAIPSVDKAAAVILVHGSGPLDRNGAVGGNAVYFDIAQQLYDRGIASLRYDKRTYAYKNMSDNYYDELTVWEETIDDVVKAFKFLQKQPGIDPERIYIVGHSLGGYLMPRIASKLPKTAGFILLAPNASPLEDLIVKQTKYINGIDGKITDNEENALLEIEGIRDRIKSLEKGSGYQASELFWTPEAYWLDLKGYRPVYEMQGEVRPILIIQGGRDYQVTEDEYNLWKAGLTGNSNVQFLLLPELNHMMAKGKGISTPSEYQILSDVDERVTEAIFKFIN